MVEKLSVSRFVFNILNIALLAFLSLACVIPFVHVLFSSLSDPVLLSRHSGLLLWPLGFTLKGYQLVAINPNITRGLLNSFFYVSVGTTINILLTSMGAYVCSQRKFMLRSFVMFMITITMFFNGGLIPYYLLIRSLHMNNTIWALLIPPAISAYNLILMRTSFMEIPDSLEESARLDGARDFTILFRIILPISKPVVAVMVLMYAVGHWNSWFGALIFLQDRHLFPLQLILREILMANDTNKVLTLADAGGNLNLYRPLIKYCTIMVSIVPIMCIYPFIQKYFVSGIMIGSIKE